MVCTLAVTQALNRHKETQLFLQTDSAAPLLKPQAQIVTENACVSGPDGKTEFARRGLVLMTPEGGV